MSLGSSFFLTRTKLLKCLKYWIAYTNNVPSQALEKVLLYLMGRKSHVVTTIVPVLLGGDQLTVTRAHGAQAIRSSHDNATERPSRVIPVFEDWHARQTLMEVNLDICYLNI